MILLKSLILESYIRVEKNPNALTVADGESGKGVYFSLARYPKMVDYYKKLSGNYRVIQATPKSQAKIIDLTQSKNLTELINFMKTEVSGLASRIPGYIKPKINKISYQRFGRIIEDFINQKYPDASAYITNHQFNDALPKGKQLVIRKQDDFNYVDIETEL